MALGETTTSASSQSEPNRRCCNQEEERAMVRGVGGQVRMRNLNKVSLIALYKRNELLMLIGVSLFLSEIIAYSLKKVHKN